MRKNLAMSVIELNQKWVLQTLKNEVERFLFVNEMVLRNWSIKEIKIILKSEELKEEKLYSYLIKKQREIDKKMKELNHTLEQINNDISNLKQGKSIMSYMEDLDVKFVEVPNMNLIYIRKMVQEYEFVEEYKDFFGKMFNKIKDNKLTITAPSMVLFHSSEYSPFGLDTEFAVSVKEYVTGSRDFNPELCLKTVVKGSYSVCMQDNLNMQKKKVTKVRMHFLKYM